MIQSLLLLNVGGEAHIEGLITDLAFILCLAAITTIIFKLIKQPVVLGYIVAGFLASPHFTYLPSVTTESNIEFWAQIGIIVLLFSLGLEFSFKKLMNAGGSAAITALIIVSGMLATGYVIGRFLGFTNINSLFLGGMLSMSSTTIILKAFDDLGLRQKKFASLVLAVLIVEDLFAVVMMVILSSIAINNTVEGSEMLFSISKLVFFLVMWFLVGVFMLPTLLNRSRRFLNNETLLIVSMGLCLGMAVFSVYCGFSLALGAFVMGSILAGTSFAEEIERVTMPVKDLFGSVFFISVGMMVNPGVIVEYWWPILLLSAVVIVGMILFGSLGMLLTGQNLRVAIESGFSLTQIGEFAFIIATLGQSLGVLSPSIYPIIVAVSVLTTFLTPYFIRLADPFYNFVERHLPTKFHFLIDRYTNRASTESETKVLWMSLIKRYLWRVVVYTVVLIALSLVTLNIVQPWLVGVLGESLGHLATVVLGIAVMLPFLLALSLPASKSVERHRLVEANAHFDLPLHFMTIIRFVIAIGFVIYLLSSVYRLMAGFVFGVAVFVVMMLLFGRSLRKKLRGLETRFLDNLNERDLRRTGRNNNLVSNMHLAFMTVGYDCPFVGERLIDSKLRQVYGVNISSIARGGNVILAPGGRERIFPGDSLGIIGTDEQIQAVLPVIEKKSESNPGNITVDNIKLTNIQLSPTSPLVGKTSQTADLRSRYKALLVNIQRGDEFMQPDGSTRFEARDVLWLVGDPRVLAKLK